MSTGMTERWLDEMHDDDSSEETNDIAIGF